MPKPPRSEVAQSFIALGLLLAGVVGLMLLFQLPWSSWYHLLAVWLGVVNLLTFAYYGYDKAQARGDRRRIAEVVLHGLAVAGGTLGAYAGMRVFRHKTVKAEFRLVFWFIAAAQLALLLAVAYRVWRHHAAAPPRPTSSASVRG